MALALGQGFAPYLLKHIASVAGDATPQYKLEPHGMLALLMNMTGRPEVKLNNTSGHRKSVRIKRKKRFTIDHTDTAKSCDQTNQMLMDEVDVDLTGTRQLAIHIDDETIAQYEEDASRMINVGNPSTGLMADLLDSVLSGANAILDGVDQDVLTTAAANIGVNRRTGDALAAAINIEQTITNNPLANGVTQILADYKNNGGSGRPQIVGSGLMYNYVIQQFAKGMDQAGIDSRIMAGAFDFYHDLAAENIVGANQVIAYQPNSIQLVEYMEYTGFKAGVKPGRSTFFTMALPMVVGENNVPVEFDVQLRYNDCAETVTDAYYGTSLTLEKGFNLIISKQFGLWTIDSQAYRGTDVLNGNRGSLRYTISNT